jgi:hypothetical protein
MGRRCVRYGLAMALAFAARHARADARVSVVRGEGADQCPDAPELQLLAASSSARSIAPPTHEYRVSFDRAVAGYRAEIVDETKGRTRTLQDASSGCAPLGHAAAVVLATMWGSEAEDEAPHAPPPQERAPPESVDRVPSPPSPPLSTHWLLRAGSGLAEGVVRPVAPAIVADGAFELGPASLSIGALWIPGQRLDLGPGSVNVQLIAGAARLCAFAWTRTRLGGCGGFFAGELSAKASGYSLVTQASRPWFAMGAELFVDGPLPFSPFRYRGAVEAIIPVHAEAFSVTGVGVAYNTPAFGALFTLSLEIESQ